MENIPQPRKIDAEDLNRLRRAKIVLDRAVHQVNMAKCQLEAITIDICEKYNIDSRVTAIDIETGVMTHAELQQK